MGIDWHYPWVYNESEGFNTGPRQVTTAIFFFKTYLMKDGVSVMVEWPANPYIKTIRTKTPAP